MEKDGKRAGAVSKGVRSGLRLGRAEHVRHASEFARIYREGRRAGDSVVRVAVARNDLGHARIAYAIGKKDAPRAHDRNRLRRLYREAFRHVKATLPAVDIIVSPARGSAPTAEAVRESLAKLVRETAARLPARPPAGSSAPPKKRPSKKGGR